MVKTSGRSPGKEISDGVKHGTGRRSSSCDDNGIGTYHRFKNRENNESDILARQNRKLC